MPTQIMPLISKKRETEKKKSSAAAAALMKTRQVTVIPRFFFIEPLMNLMVMLFPEGVLTKISP